MADYVFPDDTGQLRSFTIEALRTELARRELLTRIGTEPLVPLPKPDYSILRQMILDGTAYTIAEGFEDEDFAHYVYEAAMEAVYGKEYWAWRRKQKWAQ